MTANIVNISSYIPLKTPFLHVVHTGANTVGNKVVGKNLGENISIWVSVD